MALFSEDKHPKDRTGDGLELGRLAKWIWESLNMPVGKVGYFTDPSAVLSILKLESEGFNKFVGARVCKIKVNSDMEKEGTG